MQKRNKNWFILIPLMVMVLIFIFWVFMFIKFKYKDTLVKSEQTYNTLISNIDSWKQDLLIKQREGKRISNPTLTQLWEETYDDWTINFFNVIDWLQNNSEINADKIVFLDKIITNKTSELKILNDNLPSKINNVFEIEITDFIDNDWNFNWTLSNLKIDWGTNFNNTPDFYIILSRIKKNATINVDDNYLIDLSKKEFWQSTTNYWIWNNDLDNFAFDYVKVNSNWICSWPVDKDYWFNWCKSTTINDFLSNSSFNTNNYFYKMYFVFWFIDWEEINTPFRITSSDWLFWLWNIENLDVTLLTPNNAKRRIIIKSSNKNNVLPYLVYSLWVKWQVELIWNDS